MSERSELCFLGISAKGNREERERKDCQRVLVSVSNSYSLFQVRRDKKRGRRVKEASDMELCKNDAV